MAHRSIRRSDSRWNHTVCDLSPGRRVTAADSRESIVIRDVLAEHSLHLRAPASLLPPGSGCIGIVDGPRRAHHADNRIPRSRKGSSPPPAPLHSRPLAFAVALLSFCRPSEKLAIGLSARTPARTARTGEDGYRACGDRVSVVVYRCIAVSRVRRWRR
jgi:hypothetical protein